MAALIRQLCAVSILAGAALTLAPEGRVKRVMRFACSAALLGCIFNGIGILDLDEYALEIARNREREQMFLEESQQLSRELNRRVIEERCAAYILDKAENMGISLRSLQIHASWNPEGIWVPDSAVLVFDGSEDEQQQISRLLEADLGIQLHRQEWITDG